MTAATPPSGSTTSGVAGPGPFRIHAAAELSGVAPATLRAWERRYGVPIPRRTASAYRLHTTEDVEIVRRMRALVAEGVSPAEAARVVLGTCVDAEQHVFGLLGAALRFAASGARTVVLGAMMPPSAVADAVRSMAPRLIGLSMSVAPPGSRALFRAYGKACGATPWVVGGAATESLRTAVEAERAMKPPLRDVGPSARPRATSTPRPSAPGRWPARVAAHRH